MTNDRQITIAKKPRLKSKSQRGYFLQTLNLNLVVL